MLIRVIWEGIIVIDDPVTILVRIHVVTDAVIIEIGWCNRGVVSVSVTSFLSYIRPTITIVIGVRIVADSIAIGVEPLAGIARECIDAVRPLIAVIIGVDSVAQRVTIEVFWLTRCIQRISPTFSFLLVDPAVVIVVWVAIIADTITIVIHPFLLIEREGIDIIQPAIIIIV